MEDRIYGLTDLGKRLAKSIRPGERSQVLDSIYSSSGKTASISHIEATTTLTRGQVMSELRKLEAGKLVHCLGSM